MDVMKKAPSKVGGVRCRLQLSSFVFDEIELSLYTYVSQPCL